MSARPLSSLSLPHSTLSALSRAGYDTLHDISACSPEKLAQDLSISLQAAQALFYVSQKARTMGASSTFPLTQSAASMVTVPKKFSTHCPPVDKLLSGGLSRGHVLEISGPPGTPKETIALNVVKSFIEAGEEVIFVDSQNMTSPAAIIKALRKSLPLPLNHQKLLKHVNIHTLSDLMIFIHNLSSYLTANPKIALLVLNSVSFPFQCASALSLPTKNALIDRIKQALTKACASRNVSVVTTSQLATKVLNADGSAGNFDTGSRAVMVPQLGSAYLPSCRTHRVIIVPETRTTGVVRLLSLPIHQTGTGTLQEAYTLDAGVVK